VNVRIFYLAKDSLVRVQINLFISLSDIFGTQTN